MIDFKPETGHLTFKNTNPATGHLNAPDELSRVSASNPVPSSSPSTQ